MFLYVKNSDAKVIATPFPYVMVYIYIFAVNVTLEPNI